MKPTDIFSMNKRGQAETLAVVLVGIIVFGGFILSSNKIQEENRYVGDSNSHIYYDLKSCETKQILPENLMRFKSEKKAIENGFTSAKCNAK